MKSIENVAQLIDAIGGGCLPSAIGPVVAEYLLWDGRRVRASYYEGKENPDADFPEEVVWDDEKLRPLAEILLLGKSFIIETGRHDMICTLQWTIE